MALAALAGELRNDRTVIVFGLPSPLRAGTTVFEADLRPRRSRVIRARGLRERGWLFVYDTDPGALYPRDTPLVVIVVSERTGRVVLRRRMRSFPLVNGIAPVFLRHAGEYWRTRHHVLRRGVGAALIRRPRLRAAWPVARTARSEAARMRVAQRLRADADCVVVIGLQDNWQQVGLKPGQTEQQANREIGVELHTNSTKTARAVEDFWKPITKRTDRVSGGAAQLAAKVREQVADGCRNVFVHLVGHGVRAPDPAGVLTGVRLVSAPAGPQAPGQTVQYRYEQDFVRASDLRELFEELRGRARFKLKVDACYSGRFVPELAGLTPDPLQIIETATAADKKGWWGRRTVSVPLRFPDGHTEPVEMVINLAMLHSYTNGELGALEFLVTDDMEVAQALQSRTFMAWLLRRGHEESDTLPTTPEDRRQRTSFDAEPHLGQTDPQVHPPQDPAPPPPLEEQPGPR